MSTKCLFMCSFFTIVSLTIHDHPSHIYGMLHVYDIKVLFSHVCSTSKCCFLRCARHQSIVFSYVLDIKVSASQVSSTSKCLFSGVFNIKVSSSHVFSTSKCSFLRCLKHQSEVLSLLLGSISTSKCF